MRSKGCKRTRFVCTFCVVGVLSFSSFASAVANSYLSEKRYVNVMLPGDSRFCPIVISKDNEVFVARVAYVSGLRDIQVLRLNTNNRWQPLGSQGRALTGVGGNFLTDARIGPDGKIWVLASYTIPPNPKRGGLHFLYCYDDGKWTLMTPHEEGQGGNGLFLDWDSGLHFFGGNEPFHIFGDSASGLQFRGLSGNKWQNVPSQNVIRNAIASDKFYPAICRRKRDTWLIWADSGQTETVLKAVRLQGPDSNNVSGPFVLDSWQQKVYSEVAAVSEEGSIFVFLYDRKKGRTFGRQYVKGRQNEYTGKELPLPPGKSLEIADLKFSPDGNLYVVWTRDRWQELFLGKLQEEIWEVVSRVEQPKSEGQIFGPRIFFGPDAVPIVTWADFYPM